MALSKGRLVGAEGNVGRHGFLFIAQRHPARAFVVRRHIGAALRSAAVAPVPGLLPLRPPRLGPGPIATSDTEAPTILVNLV